MPPDDWWLKIMRSWTVGRIAGVPISVHPTVALLALILIIQQGVIVDRGIGGYVLGVVLVVCLFAAVVLHELGHTMMALHYGLEVNQITLSPVGGSAQIERSPRHSVAETLIAMSGPLVNLAIAVALLPLLALGIFIAGFGSFDDVMSEALHDVGPLSMLISFFLLNLILLGFNILPAFPMDGGRILRAVLASRVGRETGTRIAVLIGQAIGTILIISVVFTHLWALALIGAFVIYAAQAEWHDVRVEGAMRRLRVGAYALWDMGGLSPDHPLTFALRGGPRDCVVTTNGTVVGMVWRHQLLAELHGGAGNRTVSDIMDTNIATASLTDTVYDVQQWMERTDRWAIPVVDDRQQYRGIFTADRFVHVHRHVAETTPGPREMMAAWYGRAREWLRRGRQ